MKLLNYNKVLCLSPHQDDVEYVKSRKTKKQRLNHKQAKQMKELKKNGLKYPKKPKR